MKKILSPTDFSPSAENAIAYAAKLAKRIGASLHILHVHLLSEVTPEEALVGGGMSAETIKQRLDEKCLEVTKVFKVACYAEEPGNGLSLSNEISRIAGAFDMIVMGTNGENGISQDLFGSNTYRVIRNTSIPLLMVPEQCGYSDIQHLIFAYDYWRNENMPIGAVTRFAKSLNAKVTVVQVMEAYSRDAELDLQILQTAILRMYSGDVDISFDTIYDNEDIGEAVNQYTIRTEPDMLAMCFQPGKFQKIFFSGIVRRMTTETTYPLLIFH